MSWFWRSYEWVEKTFWDSLSKKLCSFLFISLFQLLLVIYLYLSLDAVRVQLRTGPLTSATRLAVAASLDHVILWSAAFWLFSLALIGFMIWYLRFLIVRPISMIISIFNEIGEGQGDLSRHIPTITHDEIRELSQSYNRFVAKMRQIINEVRQMSGRIAQDSVLMRQNVAESLDGARRQEDFATRVHEVSDQSTQGIESVTAQAHGIAETTQSNLKLAQTSFEELTDVSKLIMQVSQQVNQFNATVEDLSQRSTGIKSIVDLIKSVSEQTNLLALNASIEAARAGEAGRGFAVVADEVRKLAERVKEATNEISGRIEGITVLVADTEARTEDIGDETRDACEVIARATQHFGQMIADFDLTTKSLHIIVSTLDDLADSNRLVNQHVTEMHGFTQHAKGRLTHTDSAAGELTTATRQVQELVSRFELGDMAAI